MEVRVLASGEFQIDPVGTALQATAFPAPGQKGGPTVAITARNISPLPLQLSMRLTALSPALDDAATVRASGAGAVLVNGGLGSSASWSKPAGLIQPGATTTIRIRLKLRPGLAPDAYNGRLDIRQFELQGIPDPGAVPPTTPGATTPGATTPATTPVAATTPATADPVPSTPAPKGH
ncbi:MAG: hypothetical protein AAGC46_07375 [Solirubrobacteraceae bacterium]|nr:hypothetical protein [Patulibacter sp.]